jgi:hypothetical protein
MGRRLYSGNEKQETSAVQALYAPGDAETGKSRKFARRNVTKREAANSHVEH